MKWLFRQNFSWYDMISIAIVSEIVRNNGWLWFLILIPLGIIGLILEEKTRDK